MSRLTGPIIVGTVATGVGVALAREALLPRLAELSETVDRLDQEVQQHLERQPPVVKECRECGGAGEVVTNTSRRRDPQYDVPGRCGHCSGTGAEPRRTWP